VTMRDLSNYHIVCGNGSGGSSVSVVTSLLDERPGKYCNTIIRTGQIHRSFKNGSGPTQFQMNPFPGGKTNGAW